MIFVTVGTTEAPFDRLLRAVAGLGLGEELVVQHGPSRVRPVGARCVESLSFDELVSLMCAARVVVAHAGVGTTLTALAHGKRPVVVPRLARFREAPDDHQVEFARRFEPVLVTLVEDPSRLGEALAGEVVCEPRSIEPDLALVEDLRAYLVAAGVGAAVGAGSG